MNGDMLRYINNQSSIFYIDIFGIDFIYSAFRTFGIEYRAKKKKISINLADLL
jgi:hypothetical protein